ncbi:MAG: RagB/SusD family nutrient uptake outer membrane protein [Prevotella sp.]|nr:RagB/SusD family nutrient uptake outer membrane protein [Prevotella sp.]
MRRNIINLFVGVATALPLGGIGGGLLVSCDGYLDTTNERIVPAHDELTDISALRAATAGLYAQPWYYFMKQRFISLGDARANNFYISNSTLGEVNAQATLNEERQNASIQYSWASLYNVITQASYIINDYAPYCRENEISTESEVNACVGEARFMRALAYWYLAMYWHDVPIVDDPVTQSPTAYANTFESVIQYALCDAEYAARWLPIVPEAKGRVSQVSAWALLSRIYLTAAAWAKGNHFTETFRSEVLDTFYADDIEYGAKLSLEEFYYAKAALTARKALELAPQGGYALMDDYEQLFRVQNNNCPEVLFAIQTVASSTSYGLGNELQGMFCYDRCINKNYGITYFNWASYDMVLLSQRRGGLTRTRGNIMPHGMTYDYLYHEQDTCHTKGTAWTVERNSWDPVAIKKQVVGGPLGTDNIAIQGNSGFCTPMIRLSEVYLNLAEALMGLYGEESTTSPRVMENINAVRRRAYKTELQNGTYPGDYTTVNLDSILLERRLEFFAEGLYWTDIVRRSFMGESHLRRMLNYQNNRLADLEDEPLMGCHRLYKYSYKKNDDLTKIGTPTLSTNAADGSYTIIQPSRECVHNIPEGSYCHNQELGTSDNLWSMIYPPTEMMQDANLQKAPVTFDFTDIINHRQDYLTP